MYYVHTYYIYIHTRTLGVEKKDNGKKKHGVEKT